MASTLGAPYGPRVETTSIPPSSSSRFQYSALPFDASAHLLFKHRCPSFRRGAPGLGFSLEETSDGPCAPPLFILPCLSVSSCGYTVFHQSTPLGPSPAPPLPQSTTRSPRATHPAVPRPQVSSPLPANPETHPDHRPPPTPHRSSSKSPQIVDNYVASAVPTTPHSASTRRPKRLLAHTTGVEITPTPPRSPPPTPGTTTASANSNAPPVTRTPLYSASTFNCSRATRSGFARHTPPSSAAPYEHASSPRPHHAAFLCPTLVPLPPAPAPFPSGASRRVQPPITNRRRALQLRSVPAARPPSWYRSPAASLSSPRPLPRAPDGCP